MAITFPTSPSNGDTITSGDVTWTFDGEKWKHNIRGTAGVAYSVSADSGSTDTIEIGVDTLNIEGGTGINTVVSNNNVKVESKFNRASMRFIESNRGQETGAGRRA